MYEKIKQWFKKGLWSSEQVLNSAKNPPNKPLITQAQAEEIIKDNEEVI